MTAPVWLGRGSPVTPRRGAWLALCLVLLCGARARADDPSRRWRTIETPHFYIHFYILPNGGGEEPVAQRLATVTERVYARLTPVLGAGLRRKTHVVVTDDIDDYNGFAGVYPYPAVTLYANSPDDRAELNDYDDWLYDLFMHEFTHILHTGTIGGPCAAVVNAVLGLGLGVIYPPNQFQPRWGLEGLAVFEETARTAAGRLRNSIWDMYLRAQTLENRFQRLDQVSHTPNRFPFGNAAYLYGSALMRFVAEHYGERALLRMSRDYGSSCIPGGLNRTMRRVTGKTWVQLYHDFEAELRQRYRAQRDALAARGLTPTRALTSPDPVSPQRPLFTPDGRALLYTRSDGYARQRIARLDLPADGVGGGNGNGSGGGDAKARAAPRPGARTPGEHVELPTDAAGGPSLSSDGRWLAYHGQIVWRTFYAYNDLFLYDRVTRRRQRLTDGIRGWNPALSPDARQLVFEVTGNSSRGLGLLRLAPAHEPGADGGLVVDGPMETLIPVANMEHAYTPVFSPDGKTVAFSWWRAGGYRDIWLIDVATHALTRVTNDRAYDLEPRFSPDGRWLYFVSDRSGVYNLYAWERASGDLYQATNVINGVFDPAISPDGKTLAFIGFHADGYDVELAALDPATWRRADPPLLDRPDSETPPPGPRLPIKRYNALRTLYPFTYRPYAEADGYGEILGIQLNGSDIVGHHAWSLQLGFGTGRADDVQFAANYTYSGWWPDVNLGIQHSLSARSGLIVNGVDHRWDADVWSGGVSVSLPIYRDVVGSATLNLSYDYSYTRNLTKPPPPDPSAPIPSFPQTGAVAGFGMSWSYSNLRRFQYSVSAETGRSLALSLGLGARVLGSSYDTYSLSWRWNEYIPIPWPSRFLRNHVLALAYSGGISGGQRHTFYYLGGYAPQDLLRSIYDFSRPGTASLRGYGYGSVAGDQYHVLNAEYRFPILWIDRGFETFPLYLHRLYGRAFADYGGAFVNGFDTGLLKLGVGGELFLDITYAYYYRAALQLGYARGLMKGGTDQVYFLLNVPL